MGTFFVYILKTSICLTGFYLFYRLLLSKETFHRFNRIALLSILFLSLIIPFCEITVPQESEVQQTLINLEQLLTLTDQTPQIQELSPIASFPIWIPVLLGIYFVGIFFFLGRNLYSLFHMLHLLHQGKQKKLEKGITLIIHDKDIAPFSWMKYIVISERDLQENSQEILTHEMAHVHNRHSIDLLISDICIIFQWFNPASWLLKQELQNIHEYEADETVIRQGINAKQYQLLLIKKAVGTRLYSMANSFNHSKLKKRITMMLKEKSSPWARMKYLYILPVAAVTLTAFARPEISSELNEISAIKVNDITSILEAKEVNNPMTDKDTTQKIAIQESVTIFEAVEDSSQNTPRYTKIKIVEDTAHLKESPIQITQAYYISADTSNVEHAELFTQPVLYIVNGKEVAADSIKMMNPDKIKTVTVLKDKYATSIYGTKGKNGVISITYSSEDSNRIAYTVAGKATLQPLISGYYQVIPTNDTSSIKTIQLKGEGLFKVIKKDSIIEYQITRDTIKHKVQKK